MITDAARYAPLAPGWLAGPPPLLSRAQRHWLFRPGALTAGLRQLGRVRLEVLAEYAEGARADEACAMRIAAGSPVWVREVLMSIDGVDGVPARSLTPLRASHGPWQGMRRLSTRPLADMLYHDRTVQRSPFACRRLSPEVPFHATAAHVLAARPGARADVWARRSVFWRLGEPLLVAEGFLPAFWEIAGRRPAPPLRPHQRTPGAR